LLAVGPAHASANTVELRSGTIAGPDDDCGLPERSRLTRDDLAHGGPAIVRIRGPLTPQKRAALEARGIRLSGYLGDGAFIARLPEGGLELAEALPELAWVAPYHPGLRISPALRGERLAEANALIPITLHLFADADVKEVARRLPALGITVEGFAQGREAAPGRAGRPGRMVFLTSPEHWVGVSDEIAHWPEVLWIGPRPVYRLLNDTSAWVGQSGIYADEATPVFDHGLSGDGQTVGILDTGIDPDMCYFRDDANGLPPTNIGFGSVDPNLQQRKVTIVNFHWSSEDPSDPGDWDTHDHGTHVAGSVAGDNLATPGVRDAGDGMAPAAKLVIQDGGFSTDNCADMPAIGCPAASLYPFFEQAYAQGARIHSNSYGDRENFTPYNIYSEGSQAADEFMWDYPDMLLVFAAGNNGPGADTVASPATAKNVLAVGATARGISAGGVASFSSRGMTLDGRIKPDLTAPGLNIVSANNDININSNNCNTRSMSGTSMAAPTAAGLAALVGEYFAKGYYPGGRATPADALAPSAALVKATLIGSATAMESMTTPPPSAAQGWGRILLDDALFFSGQDRRMFATDTTARFNSSADPADVHTLQVLDSSLPLRVVLVWTDYPSTPAATVNLVNDLDLEIESPSGDLYRGNVFVDGVSVTGGSADNINNVEVARIELPEPGTWTVRVIPRSIPEPAQGYALIATGRLPVTGGSHLDSSSLVLDDSIGGNGNGKIEPGEWADVRVELFNVGDERATNVRVVVESLDANLEVHTAESALADIDPGQFGGTAAPHPRIHLSAAHDCTEPVNLRISTLADGFSRSDDETFDTGLVEILHEDFETTNGWHHVAAESTATAGNWLIATPAGTNYQPGQDVTPDPGQQCLFTAHNFPGDETLIDVDGGVVVARSGAYDLSGHPEAQVSLSRWFGNRDTGEDAGDFFRLEIREHPGAPDQLLEQLGTSVSAPEWTEVTFRVADYVTPGAQVELKVSAADGSAEENIIEAAIDEIVFWELLCEIYNPAPNDVNSLHLNISGSDVDLSWRQPDPDPAHGEANRYRVHRSETPTGGWTQLHELNSVSVDLAYTDPDSVSGAPLHFYIVIPGNDEGDAAPLP